MAAADSLFNYTVTGSNYTSQNPTDYVPNDDVVPVPQPACDALVEGILVEQCTEYINPGPYLNTCLFDVSATNDSSLASASIVAYAQACAAIIGAPRGMQYTVIWFSIKSNMV